MKFDIDDICKKIDDGVKVFAVVASIPLLICLSPILLCFYGLGCGFQAINTSILKNNNQEDKNEN